MNPLYFNDEGQPVYTYMVSVPHVNKHLIKFPIALNHMTLRGNKNNAHSPQSVLLKADTGADVNLMNRKNIQSTLWRGQRSNSTNHLSGWKTMENSAVKVLGMFHAFLRWKDKVYKQLFYMADCDRSPNLLSKGCSSHSWCSKNLATLWKILQIPTDSTVSSMKHSHASNKG